MKDLADKKFPPATTAVCFKNKTNLAVAHPTGYEFIKSRKVELEYT